MPNTRTIQTHAKINLILQVAPPITDPDNPNRGMHPICSWMHPINLADQLTIEPLENQPSKFDIRWDTGAPVDWPLESDLIHKAHTLLESNADRPLPIHAKLTKSIPAGGGLGGGSSNAAGMLMALNTLFKLGYDERRLQSIAHALGSDIPYFIDLESFNTNRPPRPAVVSGIGDQIERTNRIQSNLTLILPPFGCPTGAVYHAFDKANAASPIDHQPVLDAANARTIDPAKLINDLTAPARNAVPKLDHLMTKLTNLDIPAHLSGSGSTLFTTNILDQSTTRKIKAELPTLQVLHTNLI